MSAFATLTLQNNAAANVVFSPVSIDASGVATWLTSDSVYDAKKSVTMSVSLPKKGGSVSRIKQKIVIPIMNSVVTTQKDGEIIANVEVVIPKIASSTDRLDARKYVQTLVADAVSTAAFTNLESIY